MRRYRVLNIDFDARANVLGLEIGDDWEPVVREQWHAAKEQIRCQLAAQFGAVALDKKVANFLGLGAAPISVVSFHNNFYRQAREAFTIGAFYPALTAACALGERILNHMVLLFRDDFSHTPEYKRIYRKDSYDDWSLAIDTLRSWQLLLPDAAGAFRELREIRNRCLHFNPVVDTDTRNEALRALRALHAVIEKQFSAFGTQPWFIVNDTGISFICKEFETDPFVAKVVLPSCAYVGPAHRLASDANQMWRAEDAESYPETEVTDQEYIELFKKMQDAASVRQGQP